MANFVQVVSSQYLADKLLDEGCGGINLVAIGLDLTENARNDFWQSVHAVAVHLVRSRAKVEPCTDLVSTPKIALNRMGSREDKLNPRHV